MLKRRSMRPITLSHCRLITSYFRTTPVLRTVN